MSPLLTDRKRYLRSTARHSWESRGLSSLLWATVAVLGLFERSVAAQAIGTPSTIVSAPVERPNRCKPLPPLSLQHLQAMTDDNGIYEFADVTTPMHERGHCAEDVARALAAVTLHEVVTLQRDARRLARMYVRSLEHSLCENGELWNRQDRMLAIGDSYGRVVWGLGCAASHPDPQIAKDAAGLLLRILPGYPEKLAGHPLANSYAIQGLVAFVVEHPGGIAEAALNHCIARNLACYRRIRTDDWRWFTATMTYDTGRFPLAMLLASECTGNTECRDVGLESLKFLLKVCFPGEGSQLHPIGNQGWFPRGGTPAEFDQQPIDPASIVEACVAAARITGDKKYTAFAHTAYDWFLGNNVKNVEIYDPRTGGCRDGLGRGGANINQGAESTIMCLIARCTLASLATNHE